MTISLTAGQRQLSEHPSVNCEPLVVLETFTDRDAGTVDSTYYWSRGYSLLYKWNGVDTVQFLSRLSAISPIVRGFSHIPDAAVFDTRETVVLTLDATDRNGTYLWEELLAENVIGARVTIGSLLIDLARSEGSPRFFDLAGLGAAHVIRWRGEVTQLPELNDSDNTFDVTCETEETPIVWPRIGRGFHTSDEAIGSRYPVIVGTTSSARLVPLVVGYTTTLLADMTNSQLTMEVTDNTGFWITNLFSGFGTLSVDNECIQFRLVHGNGTTLGMAAGDRGKGAPGGSPSTTSAVAHSKGAEVRHMLPYYIWAASGEPIRTLNGVKIQNEDGEFVPIPANQIVNNSSNVTDPTGVRGLVRVSDVGVRFALNPTGLPLLNAVGKELTADADGTYTTAAPVTMITLTSDAANWGIFSQGTVTNSGTGVLMTSGTGGLFARGRALPAVNLSSNEVRFKINIQTADYIQLQQIQIWVVTAAGTADYAIEKADMVIGDNFYTVTPTQGTATTFYLFAKFGLTGYSILLDGTIDRAVTTSVADNPMDATEWFLEDYLGLPTGTADSTTFATAKTNLPSVVWGGDMAASANALGPQLARFGHESRTNLVNDDTGSLTVVKAFNANSSYDFPAATRTLTAWTNLRVRTKPLNEVANDFEALYDYQSGNDPDEASSYRGTLLANSQYNDMFADITTATLLSSQDDFGVRPAQPTTFELIRDAASAQEVFAYYATETLRAQALEYSLVVPYSAGYDLEAGDIVEFQPRWRTSMQKCRVVRVSFTFDENAVGLDLVEVT